uniref:Serpin peptidase inhibitor, clade E (nexin, plasminogen activator inhibitor type 1), member 2 n=1 Tax=Neogobius melanostomus TaxID=47308 RepID=A0A8C6TVP1_9GOBI
MRQISLLFLSAAVALCGLNIVLCQAPSYGERGSDLGIQVFQEVASSKPEDNVVLSPHGVASILGMLLSGAHGNTRKQMITALRYKKNGPYKMLKKLHKSLTAKSNQDAVIIANAMFTQEGFPLEEDFVETNRINFQCLTTEKINEWVSNKTRGHIPSLVKADMLNSALTRLVVVNSIYFKGMWKSRFQPENTKMRPFNAGNGNVYKVPMMSQLSVFNMATASTPQGLKYKVIELPYHGNTVSMSIILPSEEDTPLSRLLPHISTTTVHSWDKLLHPRKFRLLIPKFTADAEVELEASLMALGVRDMFSQEKADFRHISSEPVYVSKALQKAKVIVNEDGTKASAATTAILMARSSPPWVTVDRPFLFLIRHKPTGTILFMGQINQP